MEADGIRGAAPEAGKSLWRSPYLWATFAGLILIPLMRPLLRHEPAPPPVLGTLPAFELLDSHGEAFGREQLLGDVHVADFIFTRCVSLCPRLTASMSLLAERFERSGGQGIKLLSLTIDPEYDTPARLEDYARTHGIDSERWRLLTGPEEQVRRLVVEGFRLSLGQAPIDAPEPFDIAHSGKLVLLDAHGQVRGYYDTDEAGLNEVFHRARQVRDESPR